MLIREYVKRDRRGKARKVQVYLGWAYPGIFDIPYDPALHRDFVLHELQYRTNPRPPGPKQKKKYRRLSKYERDVPATWKAAILRDAPLLKGFFAEEPKWREKMLRWCEKNLQALSSSDEKS